ncbi:MAG: type II secretion system protein [Planctomycetales bacterium]|nr:type II secretion system protein [Planctomycetales bacterium]
MKTLKPSDKRRGFTMIELLIVIGLIALLMSFSFMALRAAISSARIAATKTTIRKVHTQLQQRFESYRFQSSKQELLTKQVAQQQALNVGFPYMDRNGPLLEVFARKEFVRRNFPQSFAELCNQTGDPTSSSFGKPGVPDVDDDSNGSVDFISPGVIDIAELGFGDDLPLAALVRRELAQANGGFPMKHNPITESAVLLHILSTTDTLGTRSSEQADFSGSEVVDTDGDGLLEVVDAWGKPLRYYRWPTRLFYPDGSVTLPTVMQNPPGNLTDFVREFGATLIDDLPKNIPNAPRRGELFQDRDDPNDWLTITWGTTEFTRFQQLYHTQRTHWELLIVSAGPDGDTGLYEPYERTAAGLFGYLAQPKSTVMNLTTSAMSDNVSNLKR